MNRIHLFLVAASLAFLMNIAFAIPENPGGINFSVVQCTGIYNIDGTTFQVDCSNDTVEISTLTVRGPSVFLGPFTTSSTFITSGYSFFGSTLNLNIQQLICIGGIGACGVVSLDEGDLYISTGNAQGAFRNARTGKSPH